MTALGSNLIAKETMSIPITQIGERFASLRIVEPQAERMMLHSMQKYGQLTPVVTCRIVPGEHELLDGFKRLRAGRQLRFSELMVRPLDVSLRACKAVMLQLNRVGRPISAMEEALVVHSLCHEDGLSQVEIGVLIGRHKSWVCRRLSLIERLSDEAQENIRLGLLPASLGVELAKLQRCNQDSLLESIRKHRLTWRETRKVATALENSPSWEHDGILRDPRGVVIAPDDEAFVDPRDEKGLSFQARRVQQRLLSLDKVCIEVACLFSCTELGQFETDEQKRLRADCARVLNSLASVEKELRKAAGGSLSSSLNQEEPRWPSLSKTGKN
jgi:ParB-like chromosome segregation protein Spo0J